MLQGAFDRAVIVCRSFNRNTAVVEAQRCREGIMA
jgi:hypothetical protein